MSSLFERPSVSPVLKPEEIEALRNVGRKKPEKLTPGEKVKAGTQARSEEALARNYGLTKGDLKEMIEEEQLKKALGVKEKPKDVPSLAGQIMSGKMADRIVRKVGETVIMDKVGGGEKKEEKVYTGEGKFKEEAGSIHLVEDIPAEK